MSHAKNRRQRRTPEQITEILNAYRRSGLTQRAFAKKHSIPVATLGAWLRRRKPAGDSAIKWLPVEGTLPSANEPLEVIAPNGWRVQLPARDSRSLTTALEFVAQQPCSP
jgi:transposase-like protein